MAKKIDEARVRPCKDHHAQQKHPNHQKLLNRLQRTKGQVEAVIRMINDHEYCPDIIQQVRAASSALKAIEADILQTHLQSCVRMALSSKNDLDANEKINELIALFKRNS